MSYEVTKEINGRAYRYRVENVRDPDTGRTRSRWKYLGRLDTTGRVAPGRTYGARVSHDDLVAATARLLRTRDASRVTVAVIAQHAGISTGTFYRHFPDRRTALDAAIKHLATEMIRDLPSLDGRIGSRNRERARLFDWFAALQRGALDARAFRWVITRTERSSSSTVADDTAPDVVLRRHLAAYLQRLHASGLAQIANPHALAGALMRLHLSFVRELALAPDAADATLRWGEVFPVIERAVFPHLVAA